MLPVIVNFYAGAGYEAEAREMEASARTFGLETDIRAVDDLGDWTLNCGIKPVFIRDRMLDYEGRPVVWLDADARVRKRPNLFFGQLCDFAAHWRHGAELLSGTMYFGATPLAWKLVTTWCEAQRKTPHEWDQRVLQRVIESGMVPGLDVKRLPATYTAVFDDPKMGDERTWIISHHQASRRLAKHGY
jgi:hypothetical protein